jgi:hypothetical protein
MTQGFDKKVKVQINSVRVDNLLKEYKKIKKYMRSPLYEIKKIDGTEKVVSELLNEYYDNPIE